MLRIMVIDDEPIVGKRLETALGKTGDHVEIFEEGRSALQRFDEQAFDIVVTDIRMDEIDGLEILDHVVAQAKQTKVIIITGYATIDVAREALSRGAFDFIAKPFKPRDLRVIIDRAARSLNA